MSDLMALLEAHAHTPWAAAWTQALVSRGGMPFLPYQELELAASIANGFEQRLRHPNEIAGRAALAAHLSGMADRMGAEPEGFDRALKQFLDIGAPGQALEHIELVFLRALQGEHEPGGQGAMVTLTWRGHAAATLAWVLGAFATLEEATGAEMDLVERWFDLSFDAPRSVEEVRHALAAASAEMKGLERSSRRHSILLERRKALRWAIEPWWPELALTPWRENDALNPTTPEQFERDRPTHPRRSADDILDMAISFTIHAGLTATSLRAGLEDPGMLGADMEIVPRARSVRAFFDQVQRGEPVDPEVSLRMVWLSAGGWALFWAAGVFDTVEDASPPGFLEFLIAHHTDGTLRAWMEGANRRPDAEIFAELARQEAMLRLASMGSTEHAHALQKIRALRWVVDYGFADPTVTPWDGSDSTTPFTLPNA